MITRQSKDFVYDREIDRFIRNFTFDAVHVDGARALAEISAEHGVGKFIQVSALNASEDSTSKFLRTKAKGEKAVREVFADATVVRPGTMYGHEDRFLNRIGGKFLEACRKY